MRIKAVIDMNRHRALWLIQRLVFKSLLKIYFFHYTDFVYQILNLPRTENGWLKKEKKVFVSKEGVVREVE